MGKNKQNTKQETLSGYSPDIVIIDDIESKEIEQEVEKEFSLDDLLEGENAVVDPSFEPYLFPKQIELGSLYNNIKNNIPFKFPTYPLGKTQIRILEWNNSRGNYSYNPIKELEMMDEEEFEEKLAIESFDLAETDEDKCLAMRERIDALCDKYVVFTGTLAKSGMNNFELTPELLNYYEEYKQIPKVVTSLRFDFIKCMDECLKHIGSRQQDPAQKLHWEAQGGSQGEKWLKDSNQSPDSIYQPDYKSCIIKPCGCQ